MRPVGHKFESTPQTVSAAECIYAFLEVQLLSSVNFLFFSQVLQSEGLVMEEELCRLRSQAELHRMQTTVIATLEGERATLERERDTLRSTVDALRTAQRKVSDHTSAHT